MTPVIPTDLIPGQGDLCANCRERPGTVLWGDALTIIHGGVVKWCEICVLEAQVSHAYERRRALPAMERKLARLKAREARKAARPTAGGDPS